MNSNVLAKARYIFGEAFRYVIALERRGESWIEKVHFLVVIDFYFRL